MGTLCIYLNFKLIWPNSAKLRGGGELKGRIQEVIWGSGAICCFMCVNLHGGPVRCTGKQYQCKNIS